MSNCSMILQGRRVGPVRIGTRVLQRGNTDKQLPEHVIFKGDNGKYMAAVTPPGTDHVYLQFYVNPEDKCHPRCSQTIHTNSDGTIRIKSDYYGKFWRLSPNWIWADSDDRPDNRDTLFRPVKISEDKYVLQSVANGNYCHRLTADYKQSCLNASSPHKNREAYLTMEEAVLSRRICDVDDRTGEARIHGNRPINLITEEAVNRGSRDNKATIALKYSVTQERKWDSSVSMKLGVKTTIQAGVPQVSSTSVDITAEFTGSYAWGNSVKRTDEHSTTYQVVVPPNTKVTTRLLATEGICEVPFSYSQEDVLTTGERVFYKFNDGIYRGVNSYNFRTDVSEEKL
ncbi:unnamed protein product [Urochloa humidicola]